MASPKKLLASAAIAAGLVGGGVVGIVLGAPGVSGAQTATVPESPGTTVAPDAWVDRDDCPDKEGTTPAPGASTNLSLRAGAGLI